MSAKSDLIFSPGDEFYEVPAPTRNLSLRESTNQAFGDFASLLLGKSPLPGWVRVWLFALVFGAILLPCFFLPHPFAIANVAGFFFIRVFNGREILRIRGINKNMGWSHIVACVPVLVVNTLLLTTNNIGGQLLTWANAGTDPYYESRVVAVWFNTVVISISTVLDTIDTILYCVFDQKDIIRSRQTMNELKKVK